MTDNTTAGQRPEFARATRDPVAAPPEPTAAERAAARHAELEAEAKRLDAALWDLHERRYVVARALVMVRAEMAGA